MKLTLLQRSALMGVLVNHLRQPDATRVWEDVVHDERTTTDELLTLLGQATPEVYFQ